MPNSLVSVKKSSVSSSMLSFSFTRDDLESKGVLKLNVEYFFFLISFDM